MTLFCPYCLVICEWSYLLLPSDWLSLCVVYACVWGGRGGVLTYEDAYAYGGWGQLGYLSLSLCTFFFFFFETVFHCILASHPNILAGLDSQQAPRIIWPLTSSGSVVIGTCHTPGFSHRRCWSELTSLCMYNVTLHWAIFQASWLALCICYSFWDKFCITLSAERKTLLITWLILFSVLEPIKQAYKCLILSAHHNFSFKQRYKMHTEAFHTWFIQHLMLPELWLLLSLRTECWQKYSIEFLLVVCKVANCHLSWVARTIRMGILTLLISCPYHDQDSRAFEVCFILKILVTVSLPLNPCSQVSSQWKTPVSVCGLWGHFHIHGPPDVCADHLFTCIIQNGTYRFFMEKVPSDARNLSAFQ